jgi:hypothetical protein
MSTYAHPVRLLRARPELREFALWLTPPFALLTSFAVLQSAEFGLGQRGGFIVGLFFYWIVWCLLVPFALLGRAGFRELFGRSARELRLREAVLLMIPPAVGFTAIFPLLLWLGNGRLLVAAAAIAILNGTCEEVLWRGTYLKIFGNRQWGGLLYPAIGFGLWHVAPLAAHWSWSPVRALWLALSATLVGLAYGFVARHTGSIRWTILSHVLMNFAGLGVLAYFA